MPHPSFATPPGRLLLGDDHRAGGRSILPQIVGDVERGANLRCQVTVRHSPATRQHGSRNAVERYPHHSAYTMVRIPRTQQYGANA
jgi:hypothetical protein